VQNDCSRTTQSPWPKIPLQEIKTRGIQKIPPPPPRNPKQPPYLNRSLPSAQSNTEADKKIFPDLKAIQLGIPDTSSHPESPVDPPSSRIPLQEPQIKPRYGVPGAPRKPNPYYRLSATRDVIEPERKPISSEEVTKGKATDMSLSQGYQSAAFFLPKTPPRNTKDRDTQSVLRKPRKPKQPPFPYSATQNAPANAKSRDQESPDVNDLDTRASQIFGNGSVISINFLPQKTKPQNRRGSSYHRGSAAIEAPTDGSPHMVTKASTASSTVRATLSGTGSWNAINAVRGNHLRHLFAGTMFTSAPHPDRSESSAGTLAAVVAESAVPFDRMALNAATQIPTSTFSRPEAGVSCLNTSVKPGATQEMDSSRVQTRSSVVSRAPVRVGIAMSHSPLTSTTDPARYLIAARLRLPPGRLSHLLKYSSDHPLSPANPMAREILATWSAELGVEKARTCPTATARTAGSMSQSPSITGLDCAGKYAISDTAAFTDKPSPIIRTSDQSHRQESGTVSSDIDAALPNGVINPGLSRIPHSRRSSKTPIYVKRHPKSSSPLADVGKDLKSLES
jgi:hypothetical protein